MRFVKIENMHMAKGGKFAIRDLRVFGPGESKAPAAPQEVKAQRHADDDRNVTFTWRPAQGGDGYLVRYGVTPDALYQCIQVQGGGQARLTVHTLNHGVKYWCRVDAFNGSGLTLGQAYPVESPSNAMSFLNYPSPLQALVVPGGRGVGRDTAILVAPRHSVIR